MKQKWTLLEKSGTRELYRWEVQQPDGRWKTLFRGKEFLAVADGSLKLSPEQPTFHSEHEGRVWLAKAGA